MLIQTLCRLAVILVTLFGIAPMMAQANQLPSFIVIFCDDLGYGDLSCFGHPTIHTPHLDRMAVEGQRWTNFYVGASVCTPSRAALLTGRLPIRNGMMSGKRRVLFPNSMGGLPDSEVTIAELLKQAGYATAAIGKWHLGHHAQFLPTRHGFESYWGIPYSNDMDHRRGKVNYREEARKDADFVPPFESFDVPILENERIIERPANQHTITRRYTQKAIEFIENHREEPFFLYLAHNLPHIPLYAGEEFLKTSKRGLYGDVVEEIDDGVGRILNTLEELELADNTLVVFTSDNGPWLSMHLHGGSAGLLKQGKGTTYEGGMRVPTILWSPGMLEPKVETQIGSTLDLLPTFCAMARVDLSNDRKLDGYDLSGVLKGETEESPRKEMFYWRSAELWAVRWGPWKAHFTTQGCYGIGEKREQHDPPLVFHLGHDPSEKVNVAAHHPEIVRKLKALAEAHRKSIEPAEDQLVKK
ncbi:MAG: sulfatase [Lacipirellulaceae bacterium]